MVRRLLCGVVLAACAGAGVLLAAERATIILSNGERMSGTLVTQGRYADRGRSNFGRGALTLRTDDGRETRIRMDQVAVIDFGGGRPTRAELGALSYDNTQLIVRRNGSIEPGRVIDITQGGDVVRWQVPNGRQQMIPFRDLSRIYLNADDARTAFNYTDRDNPRFRDRNEPGFRGGNDPRFGNRNDRDDPRFGNGNNGNNGDNRNNGNDRGNGNDRSNGNDRNRATGTAGSGQGTVQVNANQQWTSTGINVRAGDFQVFRASGRINFGQGATQNAGPDGNDSLKNNAYPVSAMPVGGLIGRVGNSAPFPIGSNTQPIRMPADGTLMLGVNDNELGDNSGFFSVAITRQ
jgi:hypothetical protein